MRILLDTCTFLWLITDANDLSASARDLFVDPGNDVYLSAVSGWEMSVKYGLGRLPLPEPPERFVQAQRERHGITAVALEEQAALYLYKLPPLHRDPFDRHFPSDRPSGG